MASPLNQLTRSPAIGLGVAITIGLALGTGALTDLLPFGRPPAPPTVAPVGPPTPTADGIGSAAPNRGTGAQAAQLDTLDQTF
jgi:hypothetical protein